MIKFEPIIKWSGSKRHQVNDLIKHFPIDIDTYKQNNVTNVINETIENYSSSTVLDVSDYAGTGASAYLYTHHQHL